MLLSVVLVLALAWPALARRAQPVKVMVHKFGDDNSIPVETEDEDYCQQGDVRYKVRDPEVCVVSSVSLSLDGS